MRIGITCGNNKEENRIVLNKAYLEFANKVTIYNSIFMLYPYDGTPDEDYIKSFDLIILSGGPDINPIFYGQPTIEANACDFERDKFELKIAAICFKYKIPILGICRGAQILGVYLGTSLKQHVDDHSQPHSRDVPSHSVILNAVGKKILNTESDTIIVNSMHHQCVLPCVGERSVNKFKDTIVGNEKIILAGIASDGTNEMFISREFPKFLGLQWHPEELIKYGYDNSKAIFNYLLGSNLLEQ